MKKSLIIMVAIFLISMDGNCQWYYRKFRVRDMNQLSQIELTNCLSEKNSQLTNDIVCIVSGIAVMIGSAYLIEDAGKKLDLVGIEYSVIGTIAELGCGLLLFPFGAGSGIYGLISLPVHLVRKKQIKNILKSTELKLGLINPPQYKISGYSNNSPAPCISMIIHF